MMPNSRSEKVAEVAATFDEREGFAEWLAENPEPKLEDLIARFGSYAAITKEGWAEFDAAMADWKERYRQRHRGSP